MPTIENVEGIKIVIHNGEHRPPHIHAIYNEFEVLIEIKTGKIYAGNLPTRQLKKVFDWIAGNKDWALSLFNELNPQLK
ncbi:MAG TPA: DUF4160 domain-containing protein [Bacteroidales bacterium]|jgi:hypothetical protein|nr:DUF4160 domain-containing protein [Bacteroidales bacterium]